MQQAATSTSNRHLPLKDETQLSTADMDMKSPSLSERQFTKIDAYIELVASFQECE
jgi:hypothetical protein